MDNNFKYLAAFLNVIGYSNLIFCLLLVSVLTAIFFFKRKRFVVGSVAAAFSGLAIGLMFQIMADQARNTLFEDERDMKQAAPPQKQTDGSTIATTVPTSPLYFSVEHPGGDHELSLFPPYEASKPENLKPGVKKSVAYHFKIIGPDHKVTLEDTIPYEQHADERRVGDYHLGTVVPDLRFKPSSSGQYEIQVSAEGYPFDQLHVRIVDFQKKDGKRMDGW